MRIFVVGIIALVLLSGCGGGDNQSVAVPTTDTSESLLVTAVKSAPYVVDALGTHLQADILYGVSTPSLNSSACNGCLKSVPISESLQAGTIIHLMNSNKNADISVVKIKRVVMVVEGKPIDVSIKDSLIYGVSDAIQRLQNIINPSYLALEIQTSDSTSVWLSAKLRKASASHRLYEHGDFSGDVESPYFLPTLRASLDYSGVSSSIATLLLKFGASVSEDSVMKGLFKYGDQALINERHGFSMLDIKSYLDVLNISSNGYKTDSIDSIHGLLAEKNSAAITTVKIMGIKHFAILTGIDQNSAYLASPLFGNVLISQGDFQDVLGLSSGSSIVILSLRVPDSWKFPLL